MSISAPSRHSGGLHLLFYVGLALFACHELDAVARHEWRLLPGLSLLDDDAGQITFVLLHIPLFILLFWLTGHRSEQIRHTSQLSVDGLLLVHGLAHFVLSGHPLYEFRAPVETLTVHGGALVGLVHAGLLIARQNRNGRGSTG